MSRIYVDTSVYLNVLLAEPGHEILLGHLRDATPCTSSLLFLEAKRSIVRLARAGSLGAEAAGVALHRVDLDIESFEVRELTLELCAKGEFPALSLPRSLDLAHLRTALWFQRESSIDAFLSLDGAQRTAAKELGLPVTDIS